MCERAVARVLFCALLISSGAARADGPGAHPGGGGGLSEVLAGSDARVGHQTVNLPEMRPRGDGSDRDLAPFLYVAGGDPSTDSLPVKKVSVSVDMAGVIARVRLTQVFENNGSKPIEAVYVFPASSRAAVHGMRMKIGGRTVEAKIETRGAARQKYESARESGQRASLLEQQRANVFSMNVANLMPRDRVEVELDYSELLIPESGVYEFMFPTVVGPRYAGGADPQKDQWMANPHLPAGAADPFPFEISAHLSSAIPIKELSSPSHQVSVSFGSPTSADVKLDAAAAPSNPANRDFILRYRLAGDRIESGLMLFPGEREDYFLMMVQPPQRPSVSDLPPREYIFVLDVSGSMWGFPLDTAKELIKRLIGSLRETDYFNVVLFSGASYVMNPRESLAATPANVQKAIQIISTQQGGGGTELMGGLQSAYDIPRLSQSPGTSRSVVVITDGYVGVEAQSFKFVREHLNEANLFAFGIGTAVNRALIEGLARAGQGEPFVVLDAAKAGAAADRFRKYVDRPVLTHIALSMEGFSAYDVAPVKIPDVMADRPVLVFGKYRGGPTGRVRLTGRSGGGVYTQTMDVGANLARKDNSPLEVLWARKWVELLDDARAMDPQNAALEKSITGLGLSHHLLTQFTSFVAVDSEVVNRGGNADQVRQPLPLPQGVSAMALAAQPMASSPPPMAYHASKAASAGPGYPMTRGRGGLGAMGSSGIGMAMGASPRPTGSVGSIGQLQMLEPMGGLDDVLAAAPTESLVSPRSKSAKGEGRLGKKDAAQLSVSVTSKRSAIAMKIAAAVKAALASTFKTGDGTLALKLRLTVDEGGNITALQWLGARNAPLESRLRATLIGLSTVSTDTHLGAPSTVDLAVVWKP